ncbi:MAG TPA: hypothetical protein PLZ05_01845 [Alphaproteobacteria bacterium]|nr:hypothetical protein [Alphaproteobacteria bacterium]
MYKIFAHICFWVNRQVGDNFWFPNSNCKIYNDIKTENVRDICPLAQHMSSNYPGTEIMVTEHNVNTEEVIAVKHMVFGINVFVPEFQENKSEKERIEAASARIAKICFECKNSKKK